MGEKDMEFSPREPEEEKDQTLSQTDEDVEGHGALAEPALQHPDDSDEDVEAHVFKPEPEIGP